MHFPNVNLMLRMAPGLEIRLILFTYEINKTSGPLELYDLILKTFLEKYETVCYRLDVLFIGDSHVYTIYTSEQARGTKYFSRWDAEYNHIYYKVKICRCTS